MQSFKTSFSKKAINHVIKKVERYPWHDMSNEKGWEYGTNLNYMKELCLYWVDKYDWRRCEKYINSFSNYKTKIDNIDIHFVLEKSNNKKAKPLLITHGWPGSFLEVIGIAKRLAHPELFGGDIKDAFDVIIPSLPGFGFSSSPPYPYGPRKMAEILNILMTDVLNYKEYLAHGNDWGSAISSWMAYDFADNCKGIHICFPTMRHIDGAKTKEEIQWEEDFQNDLKVSSNNGYRIQQATKPQTLSYAMMDSPVGMAAWIIEKYHGWSNIENDSVESAHTKDDMLDNIMLYILTKTFNTSIWIYYGREQEGGRILGTKKRSKVDIPTGIAIFPKESLPWPPVSYMKRLYNIVHSTYMSKGGHFPAKEQPELLVQDIVKFTQKLNLSN